MTAMPRSDCPLCGRNISLTKSNEFRYHRDPADDDPSGYCYGSWLNPEQAALTAENRRNR